MIDSGGGKKPIPRLKRVAKRPENVMQHEERQRLLGSAKSVSVVTGKEPGCAEPVKRRQRVPECLQRAKQQGNVLETRIEHLCHEHDRLRALLIA